MHSTPERLVLLADGDRLREDGGPTGADNMIKSYNRHKDALPRDVRLAVCPLDSDPSDMANKNPAALRQLIESATLLGY